MSCRGYDRRDEIAGIFALTVRTKESTIRAWWPRGPTSRGKARRSIDEQRPVVLTR